MANSIILLGIKHCGKTTQGKILAEHFDCGFFDTDDEIAALTKKTPRQIYSESGKEAFLKAEENACKNLAEKIEQSKERAVVATGGGICENKIALESLHKTGIFVFLDCDEESACNRIIREIKYEKDGAKTAMKNLPAYIAKENPADIADVRKIFHKFYEGRKKLYSALCDISVTLEKRAEKAENARKIIEKIESAESFNR